jgi:hypothetical protein
MEVDDFEAKVLATWCRGGWGGDGGFGGLRGGRHGCELEIWSDWKIWSLERTHLETMDLVWLYHVLSCFIINYLRVSQKTHAMIQFWTFD